MALINCPACKTRVSDKASACPKCGVPVAGGSDESKERTIRAQKQARQRQLQMHSLCAMLTFGAGAFMVLFAGGGAGAMSMVGAGLTTIGFVAYAVTRVRIGLAKRG